MWRKIVAKNVPCGEKMTNMMYVSTQCCLFVNGYPQIFSNIVKFDTDCPSTQGRNTATGGWRESTATVTIASASMDSARRGTAGVKGTRNEMHTRGKTSEQNHHSFYHALCCYSGE